MIRLTYYNDIVSYVFYFIREHQQKNNLLNVQAV